MMSRSAIVLSLAFVSQLALAVESSNAEQLLQKMTAALKALNYQGTFVHIADSNVNTMSIVHGMDGDNELERMLSLNGEAREVIRNDSKVTCIWPDSKSVMVTQSKPRNPLSALDSAVADNSLYKIKLVDSDRVAGVETHVLEIQPKDQYRYGYRIWIDKQTNMLLRSMLFDQNMQAIEEVMFTSIDYLDSIDVSIFDTSVSAKQVSWEEPKVVAPEQQPNKVQFDNLPSGFTKTSEAYRSMPINDGPISHAMLSDGIASVSVYAEHVVKDKHANVKLGHSSMGAMNAYSVSTASGLVTAVGEVPMQAVKAIAKATRLSQ